MFFEELPPKLIPAPRYFSKPSLPWIPCFSSDAEFIPSSYLAYISSFKNNQKKPTFYLAGDVFINLGVFSFVDSNAHFMPVIAINIKPGVAFGDKKAFQAYGIIGIESMFLISSPFQGFLLFDIGAGFKYDIATKIALFAEFKIGKSKNNVLMTKAEKF